MSLTSPISFVSDDFSLYQVSFFWIYCNCYCSTNHIRLMMSLKMIGLTPGTLVRAIFLFAFMNPLVVLETLLVVSVAWGLAFFPCQELSQLVTFSCWLCSYQKKSGSKVVGS